jgi:short-subunit dehydrogenase
MANIVITGVTKGIGKAVTELFVNHGNDVCICSRNENELKTYAEQLKKLNTGAKIFYRATDISVKEEVLAFGKFVAEHFVKVDVLVNNAGIFISEKMYTEPNGAIEKTMDTNFFSAYHLTRSLLPLMIPNKSGQIFNICSVASFMAYPRGGSYSASKFALLGFSKSLREEMKPYSIKVCSVMPGATYTHSWAGIDLPEERFMPAEDVAKMIFSVYGLSERSVVEEIVMRPMLGDI